MRCGATRIGPSSDRVGAEYGRSVGLRDLFRRDRDDEQHSTTSGSEPSPSGVVPSRTTSWDAPTPTSVTPAPTQSDVDRPGAHLAEGGSVSVSNEEHYQEALTALRGTDRGGTQTRATLVVNEAGNPWSTKPTGPILEVRVGASTVGFLTAAMSERYLPFARNATAEGRSLTATALVVDGTGKGGRGVEITLNALPIWQGQTSIAGMNIATTPEFILFHRTGRAHVIGSDIDCGWLTACGERLSEADAVLVLKTTPWVGRVRADGSLHADSPWWCGRCVPDDTDGPLKRAGGSASKPTSAATIGSRRT